MSLPAGRAATSRRVGGGDINEAFHVVLADGQRCVREDARRRVPGRVRGRGRGPGLAGRAGRAAHAARAGGRRALLALEWIEPGRLDDAGAEELGRGPGATHAAGAARGSAGRRTGAPARGERRAVRLAGAAERADRRLALVLRRAAPAPAAPHRARRGALSARRSTRSSACASASRELCGPPEPPARLHGDLWSGNVMADATAAHG